MMQLGDAVRRLKLMPEWESLRKLIEGRIEEAKNGLMVPCGDLGAVMQQERQKGAAIALAAILHLFDTNVPLPTEQTDDMEVPSE